MIVYIEKLIPTLINIYFLGIFWISQKYNHSPQISGTDYSGVLIVINARPYTWSASDLSNWNFQIYMLCNGEIFYRTNPNSFRGNWFKLTISNGGMITT